MLIATEEVYEVAVFNLTNIAGFFDAELSNRLNYSKLKSKLKKLLRTQRTKVQFFEKEQNILFFPYTRLIVDTIEKHCFGNGKTVALGQRGQL